MPFEPFLETRGRRLAPGRVPDPLRAHGAWVYLVVSILAGAAVPPGARLPALLAGGGFIGLFTLAGALAIVDRRQVLGRLAVGAALTIGSWGAALALGADRAFLAVATLAVPPALAAALLAARRGFLSPGSLCLAVAALVVAAPAAATGGGAAPRAAAAVAAILAPFFLWRTWRLARVLGAGWTRDRLRRRGLIESGLAAAWAALAAVVTRLLA